MPPALAHMPYARRPGTTCEPRSQMPGSDLAQLSLLSRPRLTSAFPGMNPGGTSRSPKSPNHPPCRRAATRTRKPSRKTEYAFGEEASRGGHRVGGAGLGNSFSFSDCDVAIDGQVCESFHP